MAVMFSIVTRKENTYNNKADLTGYTGKGDINEKKSIEQVACMRRNSNGNSEHYGTRSRNLH